MPCLILTLFQLTLGLSTNQTLKVASIVRSEFGRSSVQPHIKQELQARDRRLDGWFSIIDLQEEVQSDGPAVAVVYTSGLLQLVIGERGVDPHNHLVKFGMDGGGGLLKVVCSIVTQPDINNNDSSSSVLAGTQFLDTGVKKLLLLAVAPAVPETYVVMARLLGELRLQDVGGLHIAADLKMANIVLGLQVS